MNHYIEKAQNLAETVPDSIKLTVAAAPQMASFLGLTVEEWSFVRSSILAFLFILEKLHKLYSIWKNRNEKSCPTE
jgi:hypothetical protein